MNQKLIGSFGSIEQAQDKISKYFYSDVKLREVFGLPIWGVLSSKGVITGFRVLKVKNRFRFEHIENWNGGLK